MGETLKTLTTPLVMQEEPLTTRVVVVRSRDVKVSMMLEMKV
jgi:hypothetical protein